MKTNDLDKKGPVKTAESHPLAISAGQKVRARLTETMSYLPFIEANGLVRAEKVVKIKSIVDSGDYAPDCFKTAEKIMAHLSHYSLV